MAFWGVEVTPKQSHTLRYGDVMGKLILTQATLGADSSTMKSILQCEVGDKKPVYLCTLLPNKMESCGLNLEFEEDEDVKFSVVGQTSIHLSGFIQSGNPESDGEDEPYGEDIDETDSGESSDYSDDSESLDDRNFINDGDVDMFPPSSRRNSGVVIEEISDDEKPANGNDKKKHPVKKNQGSKSDNDGKQLALQGTADAAMLDSEEEDEDGFPVSREKGTETVVEDKDLKAEEGKKKNKKKKSETKDDRVQLESLKSLKRKINETTSDKEPQKQSIQQEESLQPSDATEESQKKKKKKKDKNGAENKTETVLEDKEQPKETNSGVADESGEKKKKKKKKKAKEQASGEGGADAAVQNVSPSETVPVKSKAKPGNVRNYPNGLVVEEVEMGKPDGKRATAGKKVLVRYIGKLQKNGKIFDSNIGKAPFKFILGIGQVIKGWDVGVEGMRVGDKRKLTIPPSMGYGAKGTGPIPANAWLEFNVELVNVL